MADHICQFLKPFFLFTPRSQENSKFHVVLFCKTPCESPAEDVSFEWSHHMIGSIESQLPFITVMAIVIHYNCHNYLREWEGLCFFSVFPLWESRRRCWEFHRKSNITCLFTYILGFYPCWKWSGVFCFYFSRSIRPILCKLLTPAQSSLAGITSITDRKGNEIR